MWDSSASRFKNAFEDVLREIAIMRKLAHENVMTMHDAIDDPSVNKLYMVQPARPARPRAHHDPYHTNLHHNMDGRASVRIGKNPAKIA